MREHSAAAAGARLRHCGWPDPTRARLSAAAILALAGRSRGGTVGSVAAQYATLFGKQLPCVLQEAAEREAAGFVQHANSRWRYDGCTAAGAACASCASSGSSTAGRFEEDGLWYCDACIAGCHREVSDAAAAADEQAQCCNCEDAAVPVAVPVEADGLLMCEACIKERAKEVAAAPACKRNDSSRLRYTREQLLSLQDTSSSSANPVPNELVQRSAKIRTVSAQPPRKQGSHGGTTKQQQQQHQQKQQEQQQQQQLHQQLQEQEQHAMIETAREVESQQPLTSDHADTAVQQTLEVSVSVVNRQGPV